MDAIAVIDFGSQYAHLIANRLRRLGVYSEILLPESPLSDFRKFKGIILSGGPQSVYESGAPTIDKKVFELEVPVLGLCYGHHIIAHLLGGKVESGNTKEYGLARLNVLKKIGIFEGIKDHSQVWMSHGDTVTKPPPGFISIGKTEDCEFAALAYSSKKIFSTQFHVEVAHTTEGLKMLDNFINICKAKRSWNMKMFLEGKMKEVKKMLGDRKVFLLVSGGVDSTVAYALLTKALGTERVYGLFVDTGFLRKNEAGKICKTFAQVGIKNFHMVCAADKFIKALKGITNPEEKRHIIGDMFLRIQAEETRKLKLNPADWVLGQGTIYPDTIESAGTKHSDKIKTHHNRVPEILELMKKGRIVEPLAELYKDEVREVGADLGLPDEVVWKHPFPGPGLAVRILCTKKESLPAEYSDVSEAISKHLAPHGLFGRILPIQSVGVQGDCRTYRNPLVIWGKNYDFEHLENISTALTNRFAAINRVCLLLSPKEIENVRAIPSTLTSARIKKLQELDDITMKFVTQNKLEREVWQFPSVLLPVSVNGSALESVVLRPICSDEAMTAHFYKMNSTLLKKLTAKLHKKSGAVLYDITNKPPGTIEWE
ncbi:MAG: glutamine-hydrolyzing GMP synthase [Patescibacteria group bacterium]